MSWQSKEKIALGFTPTVGINYNQQFVTGSECVVENQAWLLFRREKALKDSLSHSNCFAAKIPTYSNNVSLVSYSSTSD